MIGIALIYIGSMIGNMFSTINAYTVVLDSYSIGIPFMNGIDFRFIAFIFGIIVTNFYMYYYYRKVQSDKQN